MSVPTGVISPHRAGHIGAVLDAVVSLSRSLSGPRSTPFGNAVLTRTQLEVLFVLAHAQGPVAPGELATTLRLTRGAVTQIVEQLRDQDLVQQAVSDQDGRVRLLRLTDSARTRVESFELAAVHRAAPWFGALSDEALAQLATLLGRVEV